MKILILEGSPNRKESSHMLVEKFAKRLDKHGGKIQ